MPSAPAKCYPNSWRNRLERVCREEIAGLFQQPLELDDIMEILKSREVARHMSIAADRGDEAANHLSDVVVKLP